LFSAHLLYSIFHPSFVSFNSVEILLIYEYSNGHLANRKTYILGKYSSWETIKWRL